MPPEGHPPAAGGAPELPASMRPGHMAPDGGLAALDDALQLVASMRPGHMAPDGPTVPSALEAYAMWLQ
ncbi:MAG: hypothetical protein RL223_3768 [Pseudomonadota bacterium]